MMSKDSPMESLLSMAPTKSQMVADHIEAEIRAGTLSPGARMYGMRELASRFQVSFTAVNHAYNILEDKQMIVRKARSGTIVNPRIALAQTKLFALITSYGRDDIENYYEPLFSITGSRRIVPMIGVLDDANWRQNVNDVISRKPDCVLVDVEAKRYPIDKLKPLFGTIPVCYCNRWEWYPEKPKRAVLTDFAWAYGEALRLLREDGHERIGIMTYHIQPQPYLLEFLCQAKRQAGFTEDDRRLLVFSRDALLADTAKMNQQLKKFKPTAVFAMSDYLLGVLDKNCPAAARMEKIGLFDQKYSQPSNGNFSSFRIDFKKIWETAIASFADNAEQVTYIKPELVRRGNRQPTFTDKDLITN